MSKLKFTVHVLIAIIILPVFVYADLTVFFNSNTAAPAPAPVVEKVENTSPSTLNNYFEKAITKCSPTSYPHFINY